MNQTTTWIVAVAALVVGLFAGCYFGYDKGWEEAMEQKGGAMMEESEEHGMESEAMSDASPVAPTGIVHTVSYTKSGFSPEKTMAKLGDTLVFTNTSSKDFRPATGPHGDHASGGYAEFEPKSDIPNGGTYEIVLSKKGDWDYHNHYNSAHGGTVVVR